MNVDLEDHQEDCLKPLDLAVTAAAKWLGVSRVNLSEPLNAQRRHR
jgi:hypothetical protein